jgi:hypothetical protein
MRCSPPGRAVTAVCHRLEKTDVRTAGTVCTADRAVSTEGWYEMRPLGRLDQGGQQVGRTSGLQAQRPPRPILRGHLGELDRAANLRPCDRDARR